MVKLHGRNGHGYVENADSAPPDRQYAKVTESPRHPVEGERIRYYCEVKRQHTCASCRWNRAQERIRRAQGDGNRGKDQHAA